MALKKILNNIRYQREILEALACPGLYYHHANNEL